MLLLNNWLTISRSFEPWSPVGHCPDSLKKWKWSEMGSEDINHVCSLFNRSKKCWSLYILVRSFEKKRIKLRKPTGRETWGVERQIMQGESPKRLGAFQHPGLSAAISHMGCCWVVTPRTFRQGAQTLLCSPLPVPRVPGQSWLFSLTLSSATALTEM